MHGSQCQLSSVNHPLLAGVVEEDKAVYFPPGTMYEIALKTSNKKELRDVYNLNQKYNGVMNLSG